MKQLDKIRLANQFIIYLTFLLLSCHTKTKNKIPDKVNDKKVELLTSPFKFDTSKTLKEKVLLDYIPTAIIIKPNPKNGVPFDTLNYNKIIAYDFVGFEEPYPSVIDEKGKFVPVVLAQKALSQEQADKILSALASNSTYGEVTAACFSPHFALVFFKNDILINQINVCLDCNYLLSGLNIPAQTHEKVKIGKEKIPSVGFTKSGRMAIINLCRELSFYYGQLKK